MSRIEEALRRAKEQIDAPGVTVTSGTLSGTLFESPWQFTAPEPAVRRSFESRPAAAPRVVEPVRVAVPAPVVEGFNPEWADRLATSPSADPRMTEEFRRLASTLHQAQVEANARVVMVTSASPGDGKTLTAINLALTLSESYRKRVLLIDADLRRPSIRDVSHIPNVVGLSEALRSTSDQRLSVLQVTEMLSLVPAGAPDPDPVGGLTSPRMRQIIEDAVRHFDWVVLDAPPVATIADTRLLAGVVDAALLVVRAGQSQYPLVKKAIEAIGRERILGVVLNGVDGREADPYDTYTYAAQPPRGRTGL